jgi:hypothetical protein
MATYELKRLAAAAPGRSSTGATVRAARPDPLVAAKNSATVWRADSQRTVRLAKPSFCRVFLQITVRSISSREGNARHMGRKNPRQFRTALAAIPPSTVRSNGKSRSDRFLPRHQPSRCAEPGTNQ